MPELPEVETIRRQLEMVIVGKTVTRIEVLNPASFVGESEDLVGKRIVGVGRYGKVLIIKTEVSSRNQESPVQTNLFVHLKMSGQLHFLHFLKRSDLLKQKQKHLRVRIRFSDKTELWFIDQRKFGWMTADAAVLPRGIDALDPQLTPKILIEILASSNRPIKQILLDQSKIAGIGNIYASEILWQSKINPVTKGLTFCAQSGVLIQAIRKILNEAIRYGGSTMDDQLYRHVSGQAGNYWPRRRVYDRADQPCRRPSCRKIGALIHKTVIGQRSTYWCPGCQSN